jgi:hypothetical protein
MSLLFYSVSVNANSMGIYVYSVHKDKILVFSKIKVIE